jgi:TIR domain
MTKIFISHSSKDKDFVRKLAHDLREMGVETWLDEWEIKVGDCIVTKVEHGIAGADFVAIVLTPDSVKSGWVDREWKAKYWDEIDQGKTFILPILATKCDIPPLLKTRKYANFADNYVVAMVELMAAVGPVVRKAANNLGLTAPDYASALTTLLGKVQNRSMPVSQCVTEALVIAQQAKNAALERFCRNELAGWTSESAKELSNYPRTGGTPIA